METQTQAGAQATANAPPPQSQGDQTAAAGATSTTASTTTPAAQTQQPGLEGMTAAQIKDLYAKSPDLFKEILPTQSKAEEGKTAPQGAVAAAEELKLEIPQGATVDPEVLKEFVDLAKSKGMTKEQAQALVEFNVKLSARAGEAQAAARIKAFEEWKKNNLSALKADPEFGKDFDANTTIAQRPLAKYGDAELAKELVETGWANHPKLVKFLHKIGKAMGEDGSPRPQVTQREVPAEEAALRVRFPSMFPKEAE